jgi:hypothetical protein
MLDMSMKPRMMYSYFLFVTIISAYLLILSQLFKLSLTSYEFKLFELPYEFSDCLL